MADGRFYIQQTYTCPACGRALVWEKRIDCDSLILVHDGMIAECPQTGKKFYAPVQNLTEFKEEDIG